MVLNSLRVGIQNEKRVLKLATNFWYSNFWSVILTAVNSTHRHLRTWLSPLCKRRTYVPSPSTARLRLGKKVEFTRQCHPPCLHGCICPKMGHLQAVDPPSAIKGWEFGWVNEWALWSPEFWRRAGPMAGSPAALPVVAMSGPGGGGWTKRAPTEPEVLDLGDGPIRPVSQGSLSSDACGL